MNKLSRGVVIGSLVVATALAMGGSAWNGFVADDVPIVVDNPHVTDVARWREIPASTYWIGTLWRPFTVMGYALEWRASGGRSWFFHCVSLLLYLLVGFLLFQLLQRLNILASAALLACLFFLVHPVHVEVVANVVGQAELWTTLALITATLLYLRARQAPAGPGTVVALLVAVAIGIFAKEQGFVAPLLLLGVEWLLLGDRRDGWVARVRYLLPVTALTALLFFVRSTVTGSFGGEIPAAPLAGLGLGERVVTFFSVVPEYARLLFWPAHLQAEYGPPALPAGGPFMLRHWVGLLIVALAVVLFAKARRHAPVAAFGLWWAAITLAPVSNVVTPSGILMAERVFFLPTLGFAVALAATINMAAARLPSARVRTAGFAVAGLWLIAATIRSAQRVPVWRDQATFFTQMALDAPRSYHADFVTGVYWRSVGQPDRAVRDLREALALWPDDPRVYMMLGQSLRENHRCSEAIPVLAAGLARDSDEAILRSGLIECQIVQQLWSDAERTARDGLAMGQPGFALSLERIRRAKENHP